MIIFLADHCSRQGKRIGEKRTERKTGREKPEERKIDTLKDRGRERFEGG